MSKLIRFCHRRNRPFLQRAVHFGQSERPLPFEMRGLKSPF